MNLTPRFSWSDLCPLENQSCDNNNQSCDNDIRDSANSVSWWCCAWSDSDWCTGSRARAVELY